MKNFTLRQSNFNNFQTRFLHYSVSINYLPFYQRNENINKPGAKPEDLLVLKHSYGMPKDKLLPAENLDGILTNSLKKKI